MKKEMYALVKEKAAPGLTLKKIPVPEMAADEVMIKIKKTAICGTDVHIYNWDPWSQEHVHYPMQVGHEYVGEIVAMGDLVTGYEIGERVSGEGHIVCGVCRNCKAGQRHLCPHTLGVGVQRPGAFAEYLVLPRRNVVKVGNQIPDDIVSIFDPLGNAVHTALEYDVIGEDVLITGAGPIGIMAAAICRHNGARNIVITDMNPYRLDLAKKVEPTVHAVNVKEQKLEQVMHELHMTEGFDVGLEMSGAGPALNQMINSMRNGGRIALLGIQQPGVQIDWNKVIFSGLTIKGIYGRKMFETWYKMIAMIESGLDLSKIITHRMDFRDYEKGFEAMNSGCSGKVVLDWTTVD